MIIGCSQRDRENYPKKAFEQKKKNPRLKFNLWLGSEISFEQLGASQGSKLNFLGAPIGKLKSKMVNILQWDKLNLIHTLYSGSHFSSIAGTDAQMTIL